MILLLFVQVIAHVARSQVAHPDQPSATNPPVTDAGLSEPMDGGAPVFQLPKLIHFENPAYPVAEQARGIEGNVVLRLTVDTRGDVSEAQVLSAPSEALSASAKDAALRFKFTPAMNGPLPEASVVRYTLRFKLAGEVADVASAPPSAASDAGVPQREFRTEVTTAPPSSAATAESVYDQDLAERILRTPADLLHAVPGLFSAQHQGGGKADQYFLRGFDADHGTDIDFTMDGVPINLPSNGHGQGYTDVHYVLPETIDRLDFSKGPYFADKGDFDTAGAVELHTRRAFEENELQAAVGEFGTYRAFGVGTTGTGPNAGWIAAEVAGYNGPYDSPENLQRFSVMAKQNLQLSEHTQLMLEAVAYGSQWSASGLIPPRAVQSGAIDVWGSIDPHEGGQTQRDMLILTLKNSPSHDEGFELTSYFVRFQMRLFNDFTFFLTDPVNGDLVEQNDDRFYGGMNARYHKTLHLGDASFTTTLGAGGRYDSMNVSLFHDDSQRQHLPTCYGEPLFCDNADVGQSNLFLYAEENARLTPWFRAVLGVRGDLFTWNVVDQRTSPLPDALPTTGLVEKAIADPKLALIFSPLANLDLYIDGGGGFHSNDARSVIAVNGVGALPRAWGAEVGAHLNLFNQLSLTSVLWFLYLEEEVTFDPDIDSDAPNPPTRRYGIDFSAKWDILGSRGGHWLFADVDFMAAHVQYTTTLNNDGLSAEGVPQTLAGLNVPLAPTETLTAGITAEFPFGLKARLALRQMDDHPANEAGTQTAQGYALLDFTASYRWRFLQFAASVENVLNTSWREGQFDYVSRLPGEPIAGVEQTDYTPGNPINVQGSVTAFF
jgi:TonB family protein